jgi:hypothetical protein
MSHPDGDTYQLSNNRIVLENKFKELQGERYHSQLILADVEPDTNFGFGSQGEFFGGEVILEWDENDVE